MTNKFKVAEFAALIGCTPKTVYKMIERNELITVNERVNNRNIQLIVVTDEQLEEFKNEQSNLPVIEGECNEVVTVNEGYEPVKTNINYDFANEIIEKVFEMSDKYTNELKTVNDELVTAKSQMLFLTDKLKNDKDSKDFWQAEFFKKENELKESQQEILQKESLLKESQEEFLAKENALQKSKYTVIIWLITLVFLLVIGLITVSLLLISEKSKINNNKEITSNKPVIEVQQPVTTVNTPPKQKKK